MLWTVLLILFIRGFIVEPFKIPSGSMIPTLLVGDHIFVAKSAYDLGIPFTNIPIARVADPKRGDVIVFKYPNPEQSEKNEGLHYIKRVIGLPGDQIKVTGGIPSINGELVHQDHKGDASLMKDIAGYYGDRGDDLYQETLPGATTPQHWIQRYTNRLHTLPDDVERFESLTGRRCMEVGEGKRPDSMVFTQTLLNEICPFTVPENQYFVMGDNRDGSSDGRDWGFVERKYLKGRALFIWLSLTGKSFFPWSTDTAIPQEADSYFRWSRLGHPIK